MIVPFWVTQNRWLWKSHFPGFFFAFSFLGNFLSCGRGHAMGGDYTLSTTILHCSCWKRWGSFLGLSECRAFLEVLYYFWKRRRWVVSWSVMGFCRLFSITNTSMKHHLNTWWLLGCHSFIGIITIVRTLSIHAIHESPLHWWYTSQLGLHKERTIFYYYSLHVQENNSCMVYCLCSAARKRG